MIKDYLQAKFWVASGRSSWYEILWFLGFSAALLFIGTATFLYLRFSASGNRPLQKYVLPIAWILVVFGILGLGLGLFRKEGVGFFSAYAFWALDILLVSLLTLFFTVRLLKLYPKEKYAFNSYLLKQKYLPKRKKRNPRG